MSGAALLQALPPPEASPAPAPEPLYFGPEAARLSGWYHAPARPSRGLGFVLCRPFGYEAMCTHPSLRRLASQLAQAGHPVLCYDHLGTGDSSGDLLHFDLVAGWLEGVALAAQELRARSGVRAVALFGVRLGATLAAQAAARLGGVDALALFAPFRSGAEFLREVRAFRLLKQEAAPADGGEEVAGYPLPGRACARLRGIDLCKLAAPPAPAVLLLGRDDLEEAPALANHLSSLGCAVEVRREPGYAAMMRDAHDAVAPQRVFDALLAWAAGLPSQSPEPARPPPAVPALRCSPDAREEWVRFGDDPGLFGVLTLPAGGVQAGRPAVVFLNTGANHHVGPNRMYVAFARNLAAHGYAALRFDVSGIGDSPPGPAGANEIYSATSLADARRALDLAEARGCAGAVLVGLCSGAYVAFHVADDPRVRGQVLINQQTFHWHPGDSLTVVMRTAVQSTTYYRRAVLRLETWQRLLRLEVDLPYLARALAAGLRARTREQLAALRSFLSGSGWEHSDVARRFRDLCRRGVRTLVVLGELDGGVDVLERHLGARARKLRGEERFALKVVAGPDHTFTPVRTQALLRDLLLSHLQSHHPGP